MLLNSLYVLLREADSLWPKRLHQCAAAVSGSRQAVLGMENPFLQASKKEVPPHLAQWNGTLWTFLFQNSRMPLIQGPFPYWAVTGS